MDFATYSALHERIFAQNSLDEYVSRETIEIFWRLTERMLAVNTQMNLTAVRDVEGIIRLHYADSLTVAARIPQGARVLDIGCGAGFPSLPLAIARPDLTVVSLDSTDKKVRYVAETAQMLGLPNLSAVTARAEEYGHLPGARESFDVVLARAVTDLSMLSELCLPLVRVGGVFLAMKGAKWEDELERAEKAIATLGGRVDSTALLSLFGGDRPEARCLLSIQKMRPTPPPYPRPWGKIKKKPL